MAQTTVYICDICKNTKDSGSLSKIEVRTEGIRIKNCDRYAPLKIDVCKDCLKKKGFLVESKIENEIEKEQAELKNNQTLEDKIYDFLLDLGIAFEE